MVTATIAEIGPTRIDIRDNNGLVKQLRGDFSGNDHGINLDEADDALEKAGWLMGTARWTGTYYKAVVSRPPARKTAAELQEMDDRMWAGIEARRVANGNPRIDPGPRPASYGKR